jgi:O-antigen/teichoic acid export membrane protein
VSEGVLPAAAPAVPAARRRAHSLAARVFGAAGAISAAGVLVRLVALAAAPLLTRLLGPVPFGAAALIGTLASLLAGVGALGLDFSYSRYFLAEAGDERYAVERFCWRMVLLLGCAASVAGAAVWVYVAAPHTGADPRLGWLVAAFVLLTVLTTLSQTRARMRSEYLRLALAVLVTGVVSTGGTVALALAGWRSAFALVLGTVAGLAAGVAVAGVPRPGELARGSGLAPAQRRAVLALGLPNALTTLLYWVMTSADRWAIAWFLPGAVLGSYSFAATLAATGLMLNSGLMLVWFPEAVRTFEAGAAASQAVLGRLWSRLVMVLAVCWLAVVMAGGDVLRLLTDPRFHGGAAYIPWIAGGVFFYGLAQMSATAMVLKKDQKPQAVWWTIGAALCVALNVALVPRYGALAAAAAATASFAVIAVGVLWVSERWLPLEVEWVRLLAALVAILAMGIVGLPAWAGTPLLSLAIKLPVGVAVAALTLGWVAPDWARRAAGLLSSRPRAES